MNKLSKRFISTLMVLLMIVTMLPTFASAAGSIEDYVTVSAEAAPNSPGIRSRSIKITVYLNNVVVGEKTYTANNCTRINYSVTLKNTDDYGISSVNPDAGVTADINSSRTSVSGGHSDPLQTLGVKVYISTKHTVTVNYVYTDNSASNTVITANTNRGTYTETVLWGNTFSKDVSQKYYSFTVSPDAKKGDKIEAVITDNTTYTVTYTPTNSRKIFIDCYAVGDGTTSPVKTVSYDGLVLSNYNAVSIVSLVSSGSPVDAALLHIQGKDGKWYDFDHAGSTVDRITSLNYYGPYQSVPRLPTEMNIWAYNYYNNNVFITVPNDEGRINFYYHEHTVKDGNHEYDKANPVDHKDPTCTEEGYDVYKCKYCSATIKETISKLGHDIPHDDDHLDSSIDATCTEAGSKTYKCSRCEYTETDAVDMLGHAYGNWTYVDGSDTKDDHSDSKHSRVCANDSTHVETASCVFVIDAENSKAPTETEAGYNLFVCKDCGHSYQEPVPPSSKKWSVTYDANGGSGGPGTVTGIIQQNAYPLAKTPVPTHEKQDDVAVVFIGWTAEKDEKVYTKDDTAPTCIDTVKLDGNKTVYAVYGLDTNGNGTPDVLETKYSLKYDVNGGDEDTKPVDSNKYIAGDKATVSTVKPSHNDVDNVKVILAGWTDSPVEKILGKNDKAPEYVTEVTFKEADITVYAVWSLDTNENEIPDVNEDKYTLTYDVNGGKDGPEAVTDLLEQEDYLLDSTTKPTHDAIDDVAVVFAGWTAAQDTKIYAKGDTVPAIIKTVDIEDDTTVFAVYGYDTNGNGIADVLENFVTLTYLANGGKDAPEAETKVIPEGENGVEFIVTDAEPTREEYTFKGWSTSKDGAVEYKAGDKIFAVSDVELYAVWEQNPLVTYTITYDANGGTNAPKAQSVESRTGSGIITITTSTPSREGYVFMGWSQSKNGSAEFGSGTRVKISGDVTLYAVWAKASTKPITGDESNIALWASLAAISVLGMGAVLTLGKKRRQN